MPGEYSIVCAEWKKDSYLAALNLRLHFDWLDYLKGGGISSHIICNSNKPSNGFKQEWQQAVSYNWLM